MFQTFGSGTCLAFMFSEKSKILKKLIVFFLCLAVVLFLYIEMCNNSQLYARKLKLRELKQWAELLISPMNYNPVETLLIEEATVDVYFSPDINYQGRIPDPQKHRIVRYNAVLTNTGLKEKKFILAELSVDPEFIKIILDPWGPQDSSPMSCFPIKSLQPGGKVSIPCGIEVLAEGDPAEIEELAYRSKLRIIWEEGGKKWEKVVSVSLSEFPNDPDEYYTEDKYETGETLEVARGVQGQVEEIYLSLNFSPEPVIPDWCKDKQPDPGRHRNVSFLVRVINTGTETKRFVLIKPIFDPSFQKLIINSTPVIPRFLILHGELLSLYPVSFLAEGDPAEIEELAYKTKLRILWTEGGKKYEKIVPITPEK